MVCCNECGWLVGFGFSFPLGVLLMPWLQSPNHPVDLYKFYFQFIFPEHRTVSSFRLKA